MQDSAQCWACSRYLACTCWLSEWIIGAEEAEIICSLVLKGSLSIPFAVSSAQPLRTSHCHTHIHAHSLAIYPSPGTTGHFFFMDSPEARALPNRFFPGTIWLCSVSVMQPEECANELCARLGPIRSSHSIRKIHHRAVCPLIKLPCVDGRVGKGSGKGKELSIPGWSEFIINFDKGWQVFFFFEIKTILWVDTG